MKKFKAGLACSAALACLITVAKSHAQEAVAYQWPATREDRGSIIVVLEPEPGVEDHTTAIMLSGQVGPIDATPWHQTAQPFVKQYLVEPGFYDFQGSADSGPTKLEAEPGRATLLELKVEKSPNEDLEYTVTLSSVDNLDLEEAQSRVVDALAVHKGAPQVYLSNLGTEDYELRFGLEPISAYLPMPNPIPAPAPNPRPNPQPPPPLDLPK